MPPRRLTSRRFSGSIDPNPLVFVLMFVTILRYRARARAARPAEIRTRHARHSQNGFRVRGLMPVFVGHKMHRPVA